MKKAISVILVVALALVALVGCGGSTTASSAVSESASGETAEPITITVGATSTPHAQILEQIKDTLAAEGYELDIVEYDDYVLPNKALADGELDANYFQHTPYLNSFNESNGTDLAVAALIHYEPFGLYGNGVASVADAQSGATIIIPNDDSNETRALLLLAQEGLITLQDGANVNDGVTTFDITDDHGFIIKEVQADSVPGQFANSDAGDLAVINGNYALAAGMNIADALAIEDASGDAAQTYANIIAVRAGDEQSEKTTALVNALKTDAVKEYIANTFNGAVVAMF